jgi:hypothetical protein
LKPLLSTSTVHIPRGRVLIVAKRKELDEISRLNDAMTQILAKTQEYKKDLTVKRKQLEELNAGNTSGAE